MAGFKAHLATGMGLGIAGGVWAYLVGSLSVIYTPIIFLATVVGSFLPDVDSDSGRPVQLLFITLGLISSAVVGYHLLFNLELDILYVLFGLLSCFLIVNTVLKRIFMKFTHHRGIFHSVAALVILVLSINSLLLSQKLPLFDAVLVSVAAGVGYLSHLILDELNSIVNLSGIPFIPKKSLGTALKISTKSLKMNALIISIILALIYFNGFLIVQ